MNCETCKKKIDTLFLGKINGTYIKKEGKKHIVCFECQKKFNNDKQKMIESLPL
ncbi:MAG TPA: hypothetical protein VJH88_01250 [Candidatus Nanoarchaeia archaeon]|nr:hypothetical protein [Candidatus Nanoarchaeia archaeon]